MPKEKTPSPPSRSFTVRVPIDLYLQMGQMAQDNKTNLNQQVNQLLQLGIGRDVSLNQQLKALLMQTLNSETKS